MSQKSDEALALFKGVFVTVCRPAVQDAVKILEAMFDEE
jgi:hypothetical protein